MATTRHDTVVTRWVLDHPLRDLIADLLRQKWKRGSCDEGAHGPRVNDWARVEIRLWNRPDRKHRVLARRSITDPTKIAYYIAYAPADATLCELITVAGARWAIEKCFQTAKGQCGLDDYQVRRHQGWCRHITLAMAAHAYLTVLRATDLQKGAGHARTPDLIPLTVPEIRRLPPARRHPAQPE